MFVQVIQGQVSDPEQVHSALDRWAGQLAPGAVGWLGSTAGVIDDGRFVALARFESEEAARRNGDRPEQTQWWMETSKLFSGDVTFSDSSDITTDVSGDPDTAGFVQLMQGRGSDPERARELMAQDPDEWAAFRPDVIGSVAVGHEDAASASASPSSSTSGIRGSTRADNAANKAHLVRGRAPRLARAMRTPAATADGGRSVPPGDR